MRTAKQPVATTLLSPALARRMAISVRSSMKESGAGISKADRKCPGGSSKNALGLR